MERQTLDRLVQLLTDCKGLPVKEQAEFLIDAGVLAPPCENEPLTLDELRNMNGEPVWVQPPGMPEYGRWAIVAGVDTTDGDKTLFLHNDFTCHEYGRVWLAYRGKLEPRKEQT